MQDAVFPLRHTWISQGMNGSTSHVGLLAIDFGWLTAYKDFDLYAPFDGHVVFADALSKGGVIAFQSDYAVRYADGSQDYMTVLTAHDNNRPAVGKAFKQGDLYSRMGTAGGVGKHCHLEVQRGKFKKYTGYTTQGAYKFPNTIEPYNALFLTDDTYISPASVVEYPWRYLPAVTEPVERNEEVDQIKVLVSELRVREEPSTDAQFLGYAEKDGIYNWVNAGRMIDDGEYDWYQIADSNWVADGGGWIEIMPKLTPEEEIAKLQKELEAMTELKDKYKKANSKKIKIINKATEQVIDIGNMLNDLLETLKI